MALALSRCVSSLLTKLLHSGTAVSTWHWRGFQEPRPGGDMRAEEQSGWGLEQRPVPGRSQQHWTVKPQEWTESLRLEFGEVVVRMAVGPRAVQWALRSEKTS